MVIGKLVIAVAGTFTEVSNPNAVIARLTAAIRMYASFFTLVVYAGEITVPTLLCLPALRADYILMAEGGVEISLPGCASFQSC